MVAKIRHSHVLITVAIISSVLFSGIVVAGLFSRPIADDLAYLQIYTTHHNSVVDASISQYLGHSGRLSQIALVYVFFSFFGETATRVAPLALALALAGSIALLYFVSTDKKVKYRVSASIIVGLLISSSIFMTLPSLFDSLYWLTSSTVYITSLTAIFLTSTLIISIFKYIHWRRVPILIAVLPGIIAIQSFGEVGALVSIAISGLATVWTLANKEKRYLIKYNLVVLAGLVSGFLVNYLSPGTLQRRDFNEGSHSLSELYRNSIDPFQKMFSYTEWWHIALALFVALVIFYFLPKDGRKLPLKKATLQSLIVIASFLVVSAIAFGVSALSVGPYFVIRNYTVPGAWLFLSMAALLIIILRLLNPRSSNIIYGLFAISILLSVPYAIKKEAIYIRGMAIRDSFYSQRVISIQKQLSDNKKGRAIIVPPVKVLLYPTEAVDLEESDQPAIEWVVNMIGDHYKIPNYTSVNTPRYYCIPNGKYVRQDLTCEQSYHRASD